MGLGESVTVRIEEDDFAGDDDLGTATVTANGQELDHPWPAGVGDVRAARAKP